MKHKYLSIITNFGCHFNCPYCIVKNSNINIPRTTLKGLDHLKEAIDYEEANIVSISGGGDPLHHWSKHRSWYRKLFKLCQIIGIPLELHTSYLNARSFPYEKFYRVVYHCHDIEQMVKIQRHGHEYIRVVFVVTEDFTKEKIDSIYDFVEKSKLIDELSFRQMVDENYQPTNYCQEYLKSGHQKRWYYIEQNDYNPYYVNGTIYYSFKDIGTVETED